MPISKTGQEWLRKEAFWQKGMLSGLRTGLSGFRSGLTTGIKALPTAFKPSNIRAAGSNALMDYRAAPGNLVSRLGGAKNTFKQGIASKLAPEQVAGLKTLGKTTSAAGAIGAGAYLGNKMYQNLSGRQPQQWRKIG